MSSPLTGLQIQSHLTPEAELYLSLVRVPVPEPAAEEVVIRIEAAPINPSDISAMMGPADISQIRAEGSGDAVRVVIPMSQSAMAAMSGKVGQKVPAGIEGAGVVVAAGSSDAAQALIGKVVSLSPIGGMYAQYCVANVADLLVMKDGTTPVEAASSFVNPMTALGMMETVRREGHTALVHTAAASNLGQMLNRLCLADGVPIVNVVRTEAQAGILQELGAAHILNSTSPTFLEELNRAVAVVGATICFDVVGGGKLASQILTAMEAAQAGKLSGYHRYGSSVHKQLYISGLLDPSPTELTHSYGLAWGIGGWLLINFLARTDAETIARLKARVADEITTTFASHYTRQISLREALDPEIIAAYRRRATGEKYLVAPQL